MAGRFNVEKASEEVFDFVCRPCNIDGEVLQAKGYCSNCQDYLCDTCLKQHLRLLPMRHHVLLDENSMPKDKMATPTNVNASDTCTERCPTHSGNIIEYYCQSHDFLGCTECFSSVYHRKCEDVVCIEDATAGLHENSEYQTYTEKIGQIVNDLSKSSAVQQENDEKIMMYSIRAKLEIASFRKSMNEFLDRLENEMNKQASQIKEKQTSEWMLMFKEVEKLDDDIKTIKRTAEQTKQSGQMCNSYINMKRNLHQLKEIEDCMIYVNKNNNVSEYILKQDASLQKVVKETKKLGILEIDNTELIDALTNRLKYYENKKNNIPPRRPHYFTSEVVVKNEEETYQQDEVDTVSTIDFGEEFYENQYSQYENAVKSVKAGILVDVDSLTTPPGFPPLCCRHKLTFWPAFSGVSGEWVQR